MCAQWDSFPASMPTHAPPVGPSFIATPVLLAYTGPRRTPPTAPYLASFSPISMSGRGLQEETEGQFFYSHLQWRGVLGPSSVPFLGVIQDMYLGDTHKGRGVFSEVGLPLYEVLRSSRRSESRKLPQVLELTILTWSRNTSR